jgi:hypothetical protein
VPTSRPARPETRPGRVRRLSDVAAQALAAPPRAGATRVVAVDGRAGAGKTVLAARLAPLLGAAVVHMDDLYPGWDGLAAAVPALVDQVLDPVAAGRPAAHRRWDWNAGRYAGTVAVPPADVLLVEGVGCGARPAHPYLSILVWVEAPLPARMARALARDGEAFRPHWRRWARQEDELLLAERTPDRADLWVDGDPRVPHDPERELVVLDR